MTESERRSFDLQAPTPEHALLAGTLREFVAREVEPQAALHDRDETFNLALFRRAAALGLLGVTIGEEYGGAGLDATAAVQVYEALSTSDPGFALAVLGSILAGPRTAPLTKALVFDTQAAASVSADQNTNEDVGEFFVTITPRPAHSLAELEAAADAVISKMKADGPTAEQVQKATAGEELSFVRGLESNLGKAFQLANGAAIHGDPGYFRTEYQKTLAVTPADVKRVANKYLTGGRLVLSVVPVGKADQASKPAESQSVK